MVEFVRSIWSAIELDLQVASPGPGHHRLSGRDSIFAEMLHQRGNRIVTTNNLVTGCYIAVTNRESQTVIHRPVTFEGGACMSSENNKSVARVAQATIQEKVVAVVGLDGWTKRILDIILATTGLILFAPILLLAFVELSLDFGGPIFIRKALPGRNNQAIRVLKFRVACAAGYPINPRMTQVGQILSLTGIDELPQLINVLRGELSIVGQRNVPRWPTSIC